MPFTRPSSPAPANRTLPTAATATAPSTVTVAHNVPRPPTPTAATTATKTPHHAPSSSTELRIEINGLKAEVNDLKHETQKKKAHNKKVQAVFDRYPLSETFHQNLQLALNAKFGECLIAVRGNFQRYDAVTIGSKLAGGIVDLFTFGVGGNVATVALTALGTVLLDRAHISNQKAKAINFALAFSGNAAKAGAMFEHVADQLVIAYEALFPALTEKDITDMVEYIATQIKTYLKKVGDRISREVRNNDQLKLELLLFIVCSQVPLKINAKNKILEFVGSNNLEFKDDYYVEVKKGIGSELKKFKDIVGNCTVADLLHKPCIKYLKNDSKKEDFKIGETKDGNWSWPKEIARNPLYDMEPVRFHETEIFLRQPATTKKELPAAASSANNKLAVPAKAAATSPTAAMPPAPQQRASSLSLPAPTRPTTTAASQRVGDIRKQFEPIAGRSTVAAPRAAWLPETPTALPTLKRPSHPPADKTRHPVIAAPLAANTTARRGSVPNAAAVEPVNATHKPRLSFDKNASASSRGNITPTPPLSLYRGSGSVISTLDAAKKDNVANGHGHKPKVMSATSAFMQRPKAGNPKPGASSNAANGNAPQTSRRSTIALVRS